MVDRERKNPNGIFVPNFNGPKPRRLRRLHQVWPDRNGNISYLLTICVEGRKQVLSNDASFERLASFLFNSSKRYGWFPRRFILMPDHVHLIAGMGRNAIKLGEWIKALKAVVGERSEGLWRWQKGYHDHKLRSPESESRKWEYLCLNPVRAGLSQTPEEWPYGGEIYYHISEDPILIKGTPALLETGHLVEGADTSTDCTNV